MKKILTKYILAQMIKEKKEDVNIFPNQTGTENDLRVITPDDIENSIEDEYQNKVPEQVVENVEDHEDGKGYSKEQYPEFDNAFDAVKWAISNKESMRIHYITLRGNHLIRDIEPHGQHYSDKSHRSVIVTWDDTVSDIRSFAIQNILEFEFLGNKFSPKFFFSNRKKYVSKLRKIRHK